MLIRLLTLLLIFTCFNHTWGKTSDTTRFANPKVYQFLKASEKAKKENYELAIKYADSALAISKEKDLFDQAKIYYYLGSAHYLKGESEEALINFGKSKKLFEEIKDVLGVASVELETGNLQRVNGNIKEASSLFFSALEKFQSQQDSMHIGDCLLSIGILYGLQRKFDKSETFFLDALAIYEEIEAESSLILTQSNLATMYNYSGSFSKALRMMKKVNAYYTENGPKAREALSLMNLALLHGRMGKPQESLGYNQKALTIYSELGSKFKVCGIQLTIGQAYFDMRQLAPAEEWIYKALSGAQHLENYELIYRAYSLLYKLKEKQGKYKEALEYSLLFKNASDSVFIANQESQLNELEAKYQDEKKENELLQLNAENELKNQKIKKQENQTYLLTMAVVLLLVLIFFGFNSYRTKQKNNLVLQEKNGIIQDALNQREELLKEIHHRVKNNLQFISSLLNMQSRHVSDPKALQVLQESKNRINSMSMVHQRLYQEDDLTGVYMPTYLSNLLQSLKHSYHTTGAEVQVELNADKLNLDVDIAMPIGLIINELVTNIFKYAFNEQKDPKIWVSLQADAQSIKLKVVDNGKGLSPNFDDTATKGFGLQLVKSLAKKLGTVVTFKNDNGMAVSLAFAIPEKEKTKHEH